MEKLLDTLIFHSRLLFELYSSSLFEMSDEGVVASVEPLQVGDYGVEVYVNDTFSNVLMSPSVTQRLVISGRR